MKTGGPDNCISQCLLQFPHHSTFRTASRPLNEIAQPHRLLQPELWISFTLSHHTETRQQLALPGLEHYLTFSGSSDYSSARRQQETV